MIILIKEETFLELHIEIDKKIEDKDDFCSFLTGVVGEYYEHGCDVYSSYGIDGKYLYKEEEMYDFEYILRKEYHGFYHEPCNSDENVLIIYLDEPLKEEEIEVITRRLKIFADKNDFKVKSIKEVQRTVKTNTTLKDIKSINY